MTNIFKTYLLSFLFCIPAVYTFSQDNNPQVSFSNEQDDNIFYHTVERGQTIYAIASMYNVSADDIYRLNPSSREYIKAGEMLKIPQNDSSVSSSNDKPEELYTYHTIRQGETLYGISKSYNVSAEAISKANPGLTILSFSAGKTIRIPATQIQSLPLVQTQVVTKEIEYTIKKTETMYRLCKKFNTTSSELIKLNPELRSGLKAGMVIKVPVETEETVTTNQTHEPNEFDVNSLIAYRNEIQKVDVAKIALLLPFQMADSKNSARFVEYYEGFLLAVDSLKKAGNSIDLSVYDIGEGTQKTMDVLKSESLFSSNLIIGGVSNEQIELIADYAKKSEIKYVIPLSSKSDKITSSNAFVFQVNTPQSYLYSYATMKACTLFANYNVILVNTNDKDEKTEFIQTFKADTEQRNIPFRELNYNERTFRNDIVGMLSTYKPNVVMPVSSSMEALSKIKGPLRILADSKPAYHLTLFGYPEWQTYASECLDDFFALNTYIYTPFYANNLSPQVQNFNAKYTHWYKKTMNQTYPKYAMLGFDTGMYFIESICKYGSNFEDNIQKLGYKSLQDGFYFNNRTNNWGGFMNLNLFIVHYNKDRSISRTE